ncbi:MAG: hypothetical protein HYU99_10020 [Deltaproteobacteria bacterium]|nr:hypothetical protein [Deltaproteobacteria bacterium]
MAIFFDPEYFSRETALKPLADFLPLLESRTSASEKSILDVQNLPANTPLLLKVRLSESPESDIRDIEAVIRLEKEWELVVTLACADEKRATYLKEYLKAGQIMGGQIPYPVSDLVPLLINARLNQEGTNLILRWSFSDIPWQALWEEAQKAWQGEKIDS